MNRYKLNVYSLGIVVTTSPTCNLYSMVVLPAPSNPRIRILISLDPNNDEKIDENTPTWEDESKVQYSMSCCPVV